MRNVQLGMDVPAQRRKITHLIEHAAPVEHHAYLGHLLGMFDWQVAVGQPMPAKEFLGAYLEEFDLDGVPT